MNRFIEKNKGRELDANAIQRSNDIRDRNRRNMVELRSTRVSLQATAGQPILPNDAVVCRSTLFQRNDNMLLNPEKVVLKVYQRNPRLVKPKVSYQNEWNNVGEMSKKHCSLLLPEKVIHRQEVSYIEKVDRARSISVGRDPRTMSPATIRSQDNTSQKIKVNLSQTSPVKIMGMKPVGFKSPQDESVAYSRNPFHSNSPFAKLNITEDDSSIAIRNVEAAGVSNNSPRTKQNQVADSSDLSPDHFSQSHMNSLLRNEILPQRSFRINQVAQIPNRSSKIKQDEGSFSDGSLSPAKAKTTKRQYQKSITDGSIAPHLKNRTYSREIQSITQEKEIVLDATLIRNFTIGRIDPLNEVNFKTSHFLKYIHQNSTIMKAHFANILERKKGRLGSTMTGFANTSVDRNSVDSTTQPLFKPKIQTQPIQRYKKPTRNPTEGEYLETQADITKDFNRVEEQIRYYRAVDDYATGFNAKRYFDTYKNTAGPGNNGLARIDFSQNFSQIGSHMPEPINQINPSKSSRSRNSPRHSNQDKNFEVKREDIVLETDLTGKSPFKIFTEITRNRDIKK